LLSQKIKNSRRVLQRLAANRSLTADIEYKIACRALKRLHKRIKNNSITLEELRGYEGIGAAIYFRQLDWYFPEEFRLGTRSRRPPLNPVNAMLSWGYTIIMGEMESIIRQHGLEVGIGNLHRDKQNTPSLALDLIEPLRSAIVDLLVLNIVNHGMVKAEEHFERREDGGIYLNAEGRKIFFRAYEQAMTRKFSIEKGGLHIDFRQVMREQVFQYLRALEEGGNPVFFQLP
jgi:CRISPR-associated protein Cas1